MKVGIFFALAIAAAACGRPSADTSGDPGWDQAAMPDEDDFADEDGSADNDADAAEDGAASSEAGAAMRLSPQIIVDATGFAQPMAAATVFVPHGWKTEGGVIWAQDFLCTNGYNFLWTAYAPDGSMSVGITPQTAWEMNTIGAGPTRPGCQLMQIQSVRQFLEMQVGNTVPGARMLDYRERPDLLGEIGFQPSRTPMPAGEIRRWAEGGEILFGFERDGRAMRGLMAAVVQFDMTVSDYTQMMGDVPGARSEFVSAFAHPGWTASAEEARFDGALFEALRKSIKSNPQWARAITGHNARIAQMSIEESRKRAQMINETNDHIARLRQETWTAQQESADRRFREFGEALRGVETYKDEWGPGGQTELSSRYEHAWRLKDGTYVMTDDASFDPWRDLRLEGEKLEALK